MENGQLGRRGGAGSCENPDITDGLPMYVYISSHTFVRFIQTASEIHSKSYGYFKLAIRFHHLQEEDKTDNLNAPHTNSRGNCLK